MFQWGHDITVVETRFSQIKIQSMHLCFNGATTLQSWKQVPDIKPETTSFQFQWGHDITVVETKCKIEYAINNDIVSMGPRHYSRGNTSLICLLIF